MLKKNVVHIVSVVVLAAFLCLSSWFINAANMNYEQTGSGLAQKMLIPAVVCLIFGALLGAKRFIDVFKSPGEKKFNLFKLYYIIPALVFIVWYSNPLLMFPYANIYQNFLIYELAAVLLGYSLVTAVCRRKKE